VLSDPVFAFLAEWFAPGAWAKILRLNVDPGLAVGADMMHVRLD
jgi:hypothetical protein